MRQTRAITRPGKRRRRAGGRFFSAIWLVGITLIGAGLGGAIAIILNTTRTIPVDIADLRPTEGTKIFSSDGVLLGTAYEENREVVKLREIPKQLQNAIVAIEDSRFYTHTGLDPKGILRAITTNVRGGRVSQGGSTITQQLARNIYLTQKRTITRKLQEAALAVRIERNYSKDQILEMYLNQVYFGSRAYGVQAASKVYFGKDVKDLNLQQCALLAGLPRAPSAYDPYRNPDLAMQRRNVVLDKMAELGYITREDAEDARSRRIKLAGIQNEARGYRAPYFTSYVIQQISDQYGEDVVYRSGLRVVTTLNYEMQKAAEDALISGVKSARGLRVSQGALVCLEPKTGFIRAMVGGVDFRSSQFNRAVQAKRQPGSAFKVFVYTAAVANGIRPDELFSPKPVTYRGADGKPWRPTDGRRGYRGSVTVKRAVASSINVVAVKVLEKIGVQEAIKYARLMGITSPLDPYLSLALGSSVVSPLEMASAVGVLAAGGNRAAPIPILRVEDADGVVIEEFNPVPQRVLSDRVIRTMDELLRGVVVQGTGRAARAVPNAHGKTGTTDDNRDVWFVGYTPELCTAVWAGNDDSSPMRGSAYGATICVPIWRDFMLRALKIYHSIEAGQKPKEEPEKASVEIERPGDGARRQPDRNAAEPQPRSDTVTRTVCNESNFLATSACPAKHAETFVSGLEPTEYCSIHKPAPRSRVRRNPQREQPPDDQWPETQPTEPQVVKLTICADTGRIANKYCPNKVVRTYQTGEQPMQVCTFHRSY